MNLQPSFCLWIKRAIILAPRLCVATAGVLWSLFPVFPLPSTLTLLSLSSLLQGNLGSTWPPTLRLLNTISAVFACSASGLWCVPALWKRRVLRWGWVGRIIFPGVSSWLWECVVSLSGKNWSLVWSWAGRFCPTELSHASGMEVRGHQIITIQQVLFWL